MLSKTNAVTFLAVLSSFVSVATADLAEYKNPQGKSIWDEAPDFSKDAIPPYPDLKGPQGQDLTIASLRGVHLFGWKGCTGDEGKQIAKAYDDFYKLAQQPAVYNNIDWNDQTTKDFFGPNSNAYKIPDDTRKEIQQIFAAAQQVYSYPWTWQPPWLGWRQLWIEVRCSGNDGAGDPTDKCGDRAHNPPQCPPKDPGTPVDDTDKRLEAFSEPQERYSRITFCSKFFELATLDEAVSRTKDSPNKKNLEYWNNRARCFFHEVVHLDYFMNADDKNPKSLSPEVFDTQFKYKSGGQTYEVEGYGPFNLKILRNYIPKNKKYIGYYTQRNADTYAYYALSKYVEGLIGSYPNNPSPGKITPIGAPRKSPNGDPLLASDDGGGDDTIDALIAQAENDDHAPGFTVPGCGDRYDGDAPDGVITGNPIPSQAPAQPSAVPGRWHYPYGDASTGQFALYIVPGREVGKKVKRSMVKGKRIVGPPPPPPTGPSADATLETWIQNGADSTHFGPLNINCKLPTDQWQGFDPKDTGLKNFLSIKTGHACTLNSADFNMDYVGVKYGSIGDLAVSSDPACFGAGNQQGASCVLPL